jgi:molybdenum cofactor cytidylyltransferase
MDEKTAGVLLAAGGSNRLGYPKQLISFQGIPLISHMISVIKKGGIDDLFVVVGSHSEAIISCIKENVQIIHNPNWEEGLSASIRSALAVIEREYDAAMVFIIDQPYLHPALIIKMLATVKMSQTKIIAARASGQQTHPVVYRRDIYPDLLSLKGDRGGKEIIRKNRISWVDWPDPAILQDIDTPADAELINHQHQYQNPNPH